MISGPVSLASVSAQLAYIALGSNLGDRKSFIVQAVDLLMHVPGVMIQDLSSIYETAPVGLRDQDAGSFLNAVLAVSVTLSPMALLHEMREIERKLGRIRPADVVEVKALAGSWSRTIDLDLLLYGDLVQSDPDLTLPHPRLHTRRFVLDPLAELAPDLVHPTLSKSISQLRDELVGDVT